MSKVLTSPALIPLSYAHLRVDQKIGTEDEVDPRGIRMANRHLKRSSASLSFAISIKIPFDSAILPLKIYPTEIFTQRHKDIGTWMYLGNILGTAWETGNKLNGLKKVLLNKLWSSHTMEYSISTKENKLTCKRSDICFKKIKALDTAYMVYTHFGLKKKSKKGFWGLYANTNSGYLLGGRKLIERAFIFFYTGSTNIAHFTKNRCYLYKWKNHTHTHNPHQISSFLPI